MKKTTITKLDKLYKSIDDISHEVMKEIKALSKPGDNPQDEIDRYQHVYYRQEPIVLPKEKLHYQAQAAIYKKLFPIAGRVKHLYPDDNPLFLFLEMINEDIGQLILKNRQYYKKRLKIYSPHPNQEGEERRFPRDNYQQRNNYQRRNNYQPRNYQPRPNYNKQQPEDNETIIARRYIK